MIHNSGFLGKDADDHPADNDPGKEMRQIDNRLNRFFKPCFSHFIQHNGQYNGNRKSENNIEYAEAKGISYNIDRICPPKKQFEILHAYPGTSHYSIREIIILECNDQPAHGQIFEYQIIQQDRNKHDKQRNVLPDSSLPFQT